MTSRIVAVQIAETDVPTWRRVFAADMPEAELTPFGAETDLCEAAVVWSPPEGSLQALPRLRFVLSRGAGVDSLLAHIPADATLLRMREPGIAARMAEFVALCVLTLHRDWLSLRNQQASRQWIGDIASLPAASRTIGIMGLGELGQAAIERLLPFGFPVIGWSRTQKRIDSAETFHGADGLSAFLPRCDILVSLLPLTPETEDLIDAAFLARLPKGTMLVNAGRGRSLVEDDLLAALETGHIAGAVLDVTRQEPPPAGHPFWGHPRIQLTQHGAAVQTAEEEARAAARILKAAFAGGDLPERIETGRGY